MLRTLLLYVVASCVVTALVTPSWADEAYIFNLRDWEGTQGTYTTDCDDSIYRRCFTAKWRHWAIYDSTDVVEITQSQATADPEVTLDDWSDSIPYATDLDLITHGRSDGAVMAEIHQSLETLQLAFSAYTNGGGYYTTEIDVAAYPEGLPDAFVIVFLKNGISTHLSALSDDALVVANFCHSCESATCWGLDLIPDGDGGAILCQHSGTPGSIGCDDLDIVMKVLGCDSYPMYEPTAGAADRAAIDTESLGDPANRYSHDEDCFNPAAAFDGAFAVDGKVVFRTVSEIGSVLFFVMGVDSWADMGRLDWKSWDVLARVKPEGGRGVTQLYEVEGIADRAMYRIVEVDAYGRPTFSEPFVRTSRPANYDVWLRHPAIVEADHCNGGSGLLRQWVGGEEHAHARELTVSGLHESPGQVDGGWTASGRVDSSSCADIVVYTNTDHDSLLPPVQAHLSHYSKKILYFTGSDELEDARTAYNDVYSANVGYNQASGTSRFPTDSPGPLLLIVGDFGSGSHVVRHITFPDTYDRCIGDCHSDRDATEITGTGERVGLVQRIPCNTIAEVTNACQAADDWNAGRYVDPNHEVVQLVGNVYGGNIVGYPAEAASAAAAKFLTQGYLPKPVLLESDFDPPDWEGRQAAFNSQLNQGAAVLWGLAASVTQSYKWPGGFVGPSDATHHATRQRLIAILPGCNTAAIYWPEHIHKALIKSWQFAEPELSQIAGLVGHLDGGWAHQHRKAEELYMDAWCEVPKDAPLDWIIWRATQMAEEQNLFWMEDYLRSAATIGGYVLARPGGDWGASAIVTEADSLVFCPSGCGQAHADSVTIIVTVTDRMTGIPVVGKPPEDISVSAWSEGGFSLVCEDTCYILPCLHPPSPTDENGQAFIPLNRAGGHGPGAFLIVDVNFPAGGYSIIKTVDLEAKSPDINGDGSVDPIDLGYFGADLSEGVGWRSDFDYDGDVDPIDFTRFAAHFGHSCGSRQTSQIPPELLAQLGLAPPGVEGDQLPAVYDLYQNTPNPFNPVTSVRYAVPRPGGRVRIEVFDVAGRHVTTLVDAEKEPGWYVAAWDGTNDEGHRVSSSVYFCRMEAAGFSESRKLALVK